MTRACFLVLAVVAFGAGCSANDDIPAPLISTVMPSHAAPGTPVMISGDYLCQQPDADELDPLACANTGTVTFGSSPANIAMYTEHQVSAEVPALVPGAVSITVSVAGRRSNQLPFIVDAP